jgi:hypothetical protein
MNIFQMANNLRFSGALREFDEQSLRDEEDARDIHDEQHKQSDEAYEQAEEAFGL